MTPEVKKRIEQIRQGIVPEGYKKTKSDIVPVDWKESSIGEYICEYTEKTTIPNQYPVLTSARTGLMLQTEYYSNRQVTTENNVGYNILPFGYVTFRSRSDDGRFRFNENRIIKRGIISYFYPVFSFSEEVCHEYMLYMLNFSIYRRMYPYAEGTAQQVLSLKKLGQLKYSLPPVTEQRKIAEILATQDRAIELQGRKIEELKRYKKGCLERMFPRNGQKVPEKRFPGFTGDWEQRKLGDVVQITMGQSPDGSTYSDEPSDYILVQGNADLQNGWVCPRIWTTQITKKADAGDLIMSVRAPAGAMGKTAYNAVIGRGVAAIKGNEFIYQLLVKMDTDGFWKTLSCGSTFESLNSDNIKNAEVKIPTTAEQIKIGGFFQYLDNLITLHQRKLEEMKNQKKALMQLLLTGIVRV